ncbi:hypothetical protein BN1012_Phect1863 [Candidatus Phaeomarinobacter ectocarpi]|uniref:Uncharacterized protein n=1 Tax=Candidatus Phaeomarinibacter ectocarpi TaxID=1458461 RepID=X5MNF1_9HYPH|nr:hypothetical protein BN1012_Phect1863 [Candidatus Phaeomarinobacter ectocarpi]
MSSNCESVADSTRCFAPGNRNSRKLSPPVAQQYGAAYFDGA